jgi:hypothetical protein
MNLLKPMNLIPTTTTNKDKADNNNIINDNKNNNDNIIKTNNIPNNKFLSHLSKEKLYNQYACIRCRRLKKKCSKDLPTCSNCDKQNESCEYVERKNKRKSSINNNSVSVIHLKKIRKNSSSNSNSNSDNENAIYGDHKLLNSDNENNDIPLILVNDNPLNLPHQNSNFNKKSLPNNDSILLSPRSSTVSSNQPPSPTLLIGSNPIIQLPPIKNKSLNINQPINLENSTLPSLSLYSLQQSNNINNKMNNITSNIIDSSNLPSVPRQLLTPININNSNQSSFNVTFQPTFSDPLNSVRPRTCSKSSIRSTSPTNTQKRNTFLIPSPKINDNNNNINNKNDNNNNNNNVNNTNNSNTNLNKIPNPLFDLASNNSIEYDLLILIFGKIGYIDENIYSSFINPNLNENFEYNFQILLKLLIFLDQKLLIQKLSDFKNNKFNWIGDNQSIEDYYNSIEFLLIFTCSIIISNSQNDIKDLYYAKFTFTMAYKLLQKKIHSISNIQILRLIMLLQIISLLSNLDLKISYFIQSTLSSFALKLNLNRNLKIINLDFGITLSELEYSNRLFWTIFVTDSLLSSTTGQQPNFKLNNIDVPLPIAITKDEENKIIIQNIIINMSKIQSKIISELYTANAKNETNTDSERFMILSALRQDADMWYNECRILLSKLSELNLNSISNSNSYFDSNFNFTSNSKDSKNLKFIDEKFKINLQNFAAWISQEYYYTLTTLFKPSNLFPKPDLPNFTVISNATFQNTIILKDLITNKILPNSNFFFSRYSNISLFLLISLIKGMFTIKDSDEIMKNLLDIWKFNSSEFSKKIYDCFLKIDIILKQEILKQQKLLLLNDIFHLNDESTKLILKQLNILTTLMKNNGFLISIDIDYLRYLEFNE